MKTQRLSRWIRVPLVLGAVGVFLWWESRRPLRRTVESKPRRISRNLAIAAVSAAALQVAERPVVSPLAVLVERRQWGLLQRVSLPRWVEVPLALSAWQTALFLSVLFHHANIRLPVWVERRLVRFIVTPRMHGIHHSIVQEETNANWSSGLTLWDWLHGTLRLHVPQDEITIGVPAYRTPAEVTLPKMLALPFRHHRPTWQRPDDGDPTRMPLQTPSSSLHA